MHRLSQSQLFNEYVNHAQNLLSQSGFRRVARAAGTSAGFTIVELLIVVVIIGILAAVVVVAYNGITNSARENSVATDLKNVAKQLEIYKTLNGSYPGHSTASLEGAELKLNKSNYVETRNNFYYCRSTDMNHYVIGVDTTDNNEYYMVDGVLNKVANGTVNGANTCEYLATLYPTAATSGYQGRTTDAVTGEYVWRSWTE